MNPDKLARLQKAVRTGGKGTVRRKKKVVHKNASGDEKKLQAALKRIGVQNIPGFEEVNIFKEDGTVIHFTNPKVQASIQSNTFVISGANQTKNLSELLPGILPQLGNNPETLRYVMRSLQSKMGAAGVGADAAAPAGADDIPELVETPDFEAAAEKKKE
jgi:nascent polypeptide-associated complex subunit beta